MSSLLLQEKVQSVMYNFTLFLSAILPVPYCDTLSLNLLALVTCGAGSEFLAMQSFVLATLNYIATAQLVVLNLLALVTCGAGSKFLAM